MRSLDAYEAIVRDAALFDERNFEARLEAIELLEVTMLEEASGVGGLPVVAAGLGPTRGRVQRLIAALEDVDERLFARLRAEIAAGRHRGRAFWKLLAEYCGGEGDDGRGHDDARMNEDGRGDGWWLAGDDGSGYDALDVFTNRLCSSLPMPVPTRVLEAEIDRKSVV